MISLKLIPVIFTLIAFVCAAALTYICRDPESFSLAVASFCVLVFFILTQF